MSHLHRRLDRLLDAALLKAMSSCPKDSTVCRSAACMSLLLVTSHPSAALAQSPDSIRAGDEGNLAGKALLRTHGCTITFSDLRSFIAR
jgi:hypothetical protein